MMKTGWNILNRNAIGMVLVFGAAALFGQNPPAAPPNLAEGQKLYAQRCVGCHGADALGTDQAPGLAGNTRIGNQSVQKIRDVIRNGIPLTGMPGFDLRSGELDALAAFVHSLNGDAAAQDVPGN